MYGYGLIVVICTRKMGVGARAYNKRIIVKMLRMGANLPHFLCSTFGATIPSKPWILFFTYWAIFFSQSCHHCALSFLLSSLSNLYSIYSTNAMDLSFKIERFTMWPTKIPIASHCDSVQQCYRKKMYL